MNSTIVVHDSAAALATRVATELLDLLADLQAAGQVPAIVLTGGTIADAVHHEVARLSPASGVDWGNVEIWWGDERFVADDSSDRNARQARVALLDAVEASGFRVHEAPADTGQGLDAAASSYDEELRAHGPERFDLVMLGIGPDGHVASLFPGFGQLEVSDRQVVAVTDSPKPPPERISLTYPALNRAGQVWFLASGEGKADAVAAAQASGDVREIPARGVRGHDRTLWFLDTEAASSLHPVELRQTDRPVATF